MEKTTRYAEIPAIRTGVAFSDPIYDGNVWCQYRHKFQATDWLMKMEATRDADGYLDFALSVGRRTILSCLGVKREEDGTSFSYPSHYGTDHKEIGIDSACVFVGSLDNFANFGETAALYTAADGLFGDLYVFTAKGEKDPAGFLLIGTVDSSISDEDDLFRTILSSFDGQEINQARYEELTDREDLSLKLLLAKEISNAKNLGRNEQAQGKDQNADPER